MSDAVLHDYWRSSASYRVRIALHLLRIPFRSVPVDLLNGQQRSAEHLAVNPQGAVPVLTIGGQTLTQSLAIIEYLHEITPDSRLLPGDPLGRAHVRQLAGGIAADIHPICNLHVVAHLLASTGGGDERRREWMAHFITRGLDAFERMLGTAAGRFCHGETPTMADCCLVPQLYNARRWGCDAASWPRILRIEAECAGLDAFRAAHPDRARDAA